MVGCADCVLSSLRTTRGQSPPAGALAKTERDMRMDITSHSQTGLLPDTVSRQAGRPTHLVSMISSVFVRESDPHTALPLGKLKF